MIFHHFLLLYLVILCRASSLTLSKLSRSNLRLLSLDFSSKGSSLRLDRLTSTRMTVPKASLNEVSLVGVLAIVWYAYNILGISSSHAPSSQTLMIFNKI